MSRPPGGFSSDIFGTKTTDKQQIDTGNAKVKLFSETDVGKHVKVTVPEIVNRRTETAQRVINDIVEEVDEINSDKSSANSKLNS